MVTARGSILQTLAENRFTAASLPMDGTARGVRLMQLCMPFCKLLRPTYLEYRTKVTTKLH
jgi:hypothetical protein